MIQQRVCSWGKNLSADMTGVVMEGVWEPSPSKLPVFLSQQNSTSILLFRLMVNNKLQFLNQSVKATDLYTGSFFHYLSLVLCLFSDEETGLEIRQISRPPGFNMERRRSRAVLYQLSGHLQKQDKTKSKLKINNVRHIVLHTVCPS